MQLPAVVRINDNAVSVWLHRLVTFTGIRFLSSAAVVHGDKKTKTASAVTAEGLSFPADELQSLKQLLRIMEDDAPEKLTLQQVEQLINMCKYCIADGLIEGFAAYLMPIVKQLESSEVRPHCLGMRGHVHTGERRCERRDQY